VSQDNDPGSVRSLLALLRPSTQTNSTPTQPSWPATQTYPSLEINPFHEATYGSPQTYSPAPTPVPSQASLQALLATLKNVNSQLPSQAYASSPYGSASGPSGYQVSSDIEHSQKRRRINRDVDPYAEEHVEQSDEEKDFEIIEPPAKKQAVQVPEPAAPVPVVDIEDAQNEFGFTPEQMQDLPFQEGKEILAVLLQRRDVMNKIEEVSFFSQHSLPISDLNQMSRSRRNKRNSRSRCGRREQILSLHTRRSFQQSKCHILRMHIYRFY
jgi:hypothetical protein